LQRIGSIGVTLADSANTEQTIKTLQALAIDASIAANVLNNTTIHQESLAIFDRTFAVTRVLRWLTMGVAFIGIFSALLAMHLERSRDFAVLRASGGSRGQLQQIIGLQSLGMGLTAGLLALPLGWVMSELLIHIINVRSFGWSMGSHVPDGAIWNSLLLSIFAAVLAGIYPAWRLARRSIAHQLRAE